MWILLYVTQSWSFNELSITVMETSSFTHEFKEYNSSSLNKTRLFTRKNKNELGGRKLLHLDVFHIGFASE